MPPATWVWYSLASAGIPLGRLVTLVQSSPAPVAIGLSFQLLPTRITTPVLPHSYLHRYLARCCHAALSLRHRTPRQLLKPSCPFPTRVYLQPARPASSAWCRA